MTPREARRQRREAERKALKKSRKAEAATASNNNETAPEPVTAAEPSRAETNRRNAQRSTGPRTPEGKLASSRNSFKHGLYSKALVLPSEDPAELDALKADLRAEHQPADTTEEILVNELAEQYWRLRRMRRYETEALGGDMKYDNWFGLMALIQRAMASAERGFHKSLTTLRQMQKARGFVPQTAPAAAETVPKSGFVPQKVELHSDDNIDNLAITPLQEPDCDYLTKKAA